MSDGLKPESRLAILRVLGANPRVEKVVLFGSRAKGTQRPNSDIDLALFGILGLLEKPDVVAPRYLGNKLLPN